MCFMGKQGKGILGGFSGKVGVVQGMRKYGKDIIQSLPKFKVSRRNYEPIFELLLMVNFSRTISGLGFCQNTGMGSGFGVLGTSNFKLSTKNGGWKWNNLSGVNNKAVLFGSTFIDGSYVNYPLSIRYMGGALRVFSFGSVVDVQSIGMVNENYGILWRNGSLGFYRDFCLGQLQMVFAVDDFIGIESRLHCNPAQSNTGIINVEIGGKIVPA